MDDPFKAATAAYLAEVEAEKFIDDLSVVDPQNAILISQAVFSDMGNQLYEDGQVINQGDDYGDE